MMKRGKATWLAATLDAAFAWGNAAHAQLPGVLYTWNGTGYTPTAYPTYFGTAAGLMSTARDYLKFSMALDRDALQFGVHRESRSEQRNVVGSDHERAGSHSTEAGCDRSDIGQMLSIGPATAVGEDDVVLVAVDSRSGQELAERAGAILVDLERLSEHLFPGELERAAGRLEPPVGCFDREESGGFGRAHRGSPGTEQRWIALVHPGSAGSPGAPPAVLRADELVRVLDPGLVGLARMGALSEMHHAAITAARGPLAVEFDPVVPEQVLTRPAAVEVGADRLADRLEALLGPGLEVHLDVVGEDVR